MDERNNNEKDIHSAFESVETGVSEQKSSSGHESVGNGDSEEKCSSGHEERQMTRSPDLFTEESLPESSETNVSPLHQVSDLLLNEPQNLTEEATKNYRTKVLQRLQELCENQQDILSLQRSILAAVAVPGGEAEEEILAGPCQNVEAFKELDIALNNKEKRTKMMNYLRSLGGANPGAAYAKCCVRCIERSAECLQPEGEEEQTCLPRPQHLL
ncbi:uncharacterized protein LOC127659531 [Xyrauchen texanus]|uniref:uncharacterized protein LOC127659531 n=1 Tax=Xyrauchen texanus TaxID=154827 RepID=UPI002241C235|nr:uncharacterized protein LOC127659531 [Xyrauchen texanus]